MGFLIQPKHIFIAILLIFSAMSVVAFGASAAGPSITVDRNGSLGVIKGMVLDGGGSPIADATVAVFRLGTSRLLKQVSTAGDGSFLAKVLPGTYTILAVAQGFNPVTLASVEVNRAAEMIYGFKLERSGNGNTLPEKRLDRNSSKWHIRAAQMQRSIYQNREGKTLDTDTESDTDNEQLERSSGGRGQTVVETYFVGTTNGNYTGVNFATLVPVNGNTEVVLAGQVAKGRNAPQRIETDLRFRPNGEHQVRLNSAFAKLGLVNAANIENTLGQLSFQVSDEWKVRDGVILVLGVDYSRFVGAGNDFVVSPRFGLQFDVDSKTRVRAGFTTQTEEKNWAHAAELEGSEVAFTEPVAVEDFVIEKGRPQMNKSSRLEIGIERVLNRKSSVEANAFVDTTLGRGIGINALPFDTLGGSNFSDFVADQQGRATGLRVVYSQRLNGTLSTSAGYAIGNGQKLSAKAFTDPADVFESAFFQSLFGQIAADLKTGTSLKAIFRLSPQATVFAIDPFKGRLAIYDPGLSVLVTQSLPNLGLPFRAEAVVDARNIFDLQRGISGTDGSLRFDGQRRTLRGGILVRF